MIGLIFLLVLAWQFYIGYMRGILLQAYYGLASILSLFVANHFYQGLATKLTLWVPFVNPHQDTKMLFFESISPFELDKVFYAGLAFIVIYMLAYFTFRFLGIFLHLADLDKFDSPLLNAVSGGLTVVVTIIMFSMGATLLATVPANQLQTFLAGHTTTKLLINFPILAQLWQYFWVTRIF